MHTNDIAVVMTTITTLAFAMEVAMVTPGGMRLAEDIPSSYYHSDRMVAAVAVGMAPLTVPMARWWPPHGIPIGYGSRVGIRALIPDSQFSQLANYI